MASKASGTTKKGSSSNPKGLLNEGIGNAGNTLATALQSGSFQKMSYAEQDRLLEAADKEAPKLDEKRNIYTDAEWDAMGAYLFQFYINTIMTNFDIQKYKIK